MTLNCVSGEGLISVSDTHLYSQYMFELLLCFIDLSYQNQVTPPSNVLCLIILSNLIYLLFYLQSSAFGFLLAQRHFTNPLVAVPSAVSVVCMAVR